MSRGINKAIIVGHACADPEVRHMPNGTAVTTIPIATNESWTDKATGEAKERVEYHRIEAFGKLAEIMGQYLRKGSQVYIEGSIRTDKWTDPQGVEKYSTKIRAETMQMLGGKPSDTTEFNQAQNTSSSAKQPSANQANQQKQFEKPDMDDDFAVDIPF